MHMHVGETDLTKEKQKNIVDSKMALILLSLKSDAKYINHPVK